MDDTAPFEQRTVDETVDAIERRNTRVRAFIYIVCAVAVAAMAALLLLAVDTVGRLERIGERQLSELDAQEAQLANLQRLANQQADELASSRQERHILEARIVQLQEALRDQGIDVPAQTVTPEQIAQAVAEYCATGACAGPSGPPGPPGPCVRPNGRPC